MENKKTKFNKTIYLFLLLTIISIINSMDNYSLNTNIGYSIFTFYILPRFNISIIDKINGEEFKGTNLKCIYTPNKSIEINYKIRKPYENEIIDKRENKNSVEVLEIEIIKNSEKISLKILITEINDLDLKVMFEEVPWIIRGINEFLNVLTGELSFDMENTKIYLENQKILGKELKNIYPNINFPKSTSDEIFELRITKQPEISYRLKFADEEQSKEKLNPFDQLLKELGKDVNDPIYSNRLEEIKKIISKLTGELIYNNQEKDLSQLNKFLISQIYGDEYDFIFIKDLIMFLENYEIFSTLLNHKFDYEYIESLYIKMVKYFDLYNLKTDDQRINKFVNFLIENKIFLNSDENNEFEIFLYSLI